VIQGKYMLAQGSWAPGICGVAVITFFSEYSRVDGRFCVALRTFRRCAPVNLIHMAIHALYFCVLSIQKEEIIMLEIV
jgi:hypothetical protein